MNELLRLHFDLLDVQPLLGVIGAECALHHLAIAGEGTRLLPVQVFGFVSDGHCHIWTHLLILYQFRQLLTAIKAV